MSGQDVTRKNIPGELRDSMDLVTKPAPSSGASDYTPELVSRLKRLGFPRPPGVSWTDWMGPRKITPRTELIAHLHVRGMTNKAIAEEVGILPQRVSYILNSSRVKAIVEQLRDKVFGDSTAESRFRKIGMQAIETAERIMTDPNSRAADKLRASKDFMDRAFGKPKETLEIQNGSIKQIFDYLDQQGNIGSIKVQTGQANLSSVEVVKKPTETVTEPFVPKPGHVNLDEWVDGNVPVDDRSLPSGETKE